MSDTPDIAALGTLTLNETSNVNNLTFVGSHSKAMLTLKSDGSIEIGPGLSADEATQAVARMLVEHYGKALTVEIERLEAERDALRAVEVAARNLALYVKNSVNAGPVTKGPHKEAALWRALHAALQSTGEREP